MAKKVTPDFRNLFQEAHQKDKPYRKATGEQMRISL